MQKKNNKKMVVWSFLFIFGLCCHFSLSANAQKNVIANNDDDFGRELARICSTYSESKSGRAGASSKSRYSLKRLLVKTNGSSLDLEDINAVEVLQNKQNLYIMQFESIQDTEKAAKILKKQSGIKYVEPDKKVSIPKTSKSSASRASINARVSTAWSWGVSRIGADVYASQVKKCVGTKAITVAIVDTGIYKHPAISSHIVEGYNYVERNKNTTDLNGHGTHVAGTIYDCTRGLNVKLMPVRVLNGLGEGYLSTMGYGIRYAVNHGAKVINMSANSDDGGHDDYLHESVDYAINKNVVIVNSAGNQGSDTSVSCPAEMKGAIVVGAVDSNNKIAYFSNTGDSIDVVAPGIDIYSTYLNDGYTLLDGTSMAAPHITGLVATMRLMYPSYSPATVEKELKKRGKDLGSPGFDPVYGAGIPDFGKENLVSITKITLNKSSSTLKVAETDKLNVTITPASASNKEITWSSSDSTVAAVKGGTIIARKKGKATITAKTANGKTATCVVTVDAAAMLPRDNFYLGSYNSGTKKASITVKPFQGSTGLQVELQDVNKKTIATMKGKQSCIFTKLSKQKAYYYRARAYYEIENYTVYGTWSYRRIFSTAEATIKKTKSAKGVYIVMPKVSKVQKFDVYFSTSGKTGSYQKIFATVPGKSVYYSKFQGKALTSYGTTHKFYVYLKPVYSISGKADEKFAKVTFSLK